MTALRPDQDPEVETRLLREAARLYATSSLERQHERALREITQALAADLDERHVLELAVMHSAQLLQAPYARVWLLRPDGELSCAAAEGYVHAETFHRRLERDSTSGRAARQRLVNLSDAPSEPSWMSNREFGQRTGLGAYLGAGLWRAGESLGVLEVMRNAGHRFSSTEEQLLVTLASAVAVAVSNARTHAAVGTLAREAEQRAEALAESELVLRSVLDAAGFGLLVADELGGVVNANAAAMEILGRSVDELRAMRWDECLPIIGQNTVFEAGQDGLDPLAVLHGDPLRKYVIELTRPDGQHRWLQVDAVPLYGLQGEVKRVISSFVDITDQRRSEIALQQRDAILESVAFAAEQLLRAPEWEHTIDGVLARLGAATGVSRVYIAPLMLEGPGDTAIHQWTAPKVVRRPAPDAGGLYLEAIGLGAWEPILRAGGTIDGRVETFPQDEQRALRACGVCSILMVPIFAGDTCWGVIGFDDCVDERLWAAGAVEVLNTAARTLGAAMLRRRADTERLQLAREQSARVEAVAAQARLAFLAEASQTLAASLDYESTLQGVADLVVPGLADCCLIDVREVDGGIRRVASAVAEPFVASVGDLVGALTDPNSDHPIAVVMRSRQPHMATALRTRFHQRAGRAFDSAISVPLLTRSGATGAITWLVSAARPPYGPLDLELAQDLARRCALAIDNARLYTEARIAVSIRDEFMSVAAHELKTPMTSLRGYAQLLSREFETGENQSSERVRRAARTIQLQSDKLAYLIGQLLDISRIQFGKLSLERTSADLSELVEDVLEVARHRLTRHALIARLPPQLMVVIDPLRIEQVLTNLIDNAIKYSPEGGKIEVSLAAKTDVVRLTVRDYGIGVPLEHRPHIFDRLYQAHAGGPLTSMAGMGLGLYISRQIVELHGGRIEADFPTGGGTQIVMTLPREQR